MKVKKAVSGGGPVTTDEWTDLTLSCVPANNKYSKLVCVCWSSVVQADRRGVRAHRR